MRNDDNAGVIVDETDNFDDKNTDETHTSQHTQSDQPAASAGPTFPTLIEETIPLWEQAPEWPGGDFEPPSYAGPSGSTSSTADATSDYTEKDEEDGVKTDVSGATTTDENFNTSATQTDGNTQWQSTAGNYSDSSGNGGSFTSVVATSHSDSETDKNNGTDDAGVTTDDYNNKGSQSDAKNTSYSFDATSSVGGITAHGHGKNTANYSDTTSFTETGDYTDDPSQPEADGYSKLDQTIGYKETVIEGATQQLTGDESGGDANSNVSLSGSGTYTTDASQSINSNSTVNDNVAAGTDTQSGSYSVDNSVGTSSNFQVTGTYVEGAGNSWNTTGVIYHHSATSSSTDDDTGPYSTPAASGTETLAGNTTDHMDATITTNGFSVSWTGNSGSNQTPKNVPDYLCAQSWADDTVVRMVPAPPLHPDQITRRVDPAKHGGLGLDFSGERGSVNIAVIMGGGEHPPARQKVPLNKQEPGGVPGTPGSGIVGFVSTLPGKIRGNEGKNINVPTKLYGSSNGEFVPGAGTTQVSRSAQEIAKEQLEQIRSQVFDKKGNLKLEAGEVHRLLLIGHSWGADKAIEVTNILADLLAHDDQLWDLYQKDFIQIHLRLVDPIGRPGPGSPGDQPSGATLNPDARVASAYGFFQTDQTPLDLTDASGNKIRLQLRGTTRFGGILIVPKDMTPNIAGNAPEQHHAFTFTFKAVRNMILESLGLALEE